MPSTYAMQREGASEQRGREEGVYIRRAFTDPTMDDGRGRTDGRRAKYITRALYSLLSVGGICLELTLGTNKL